MKGLIVAGGKAPNLQFLHKVAINSEIIIAADKGCNYLSNIDILPQYLVGDFDSVDKYSLEGMIQKGVTKYEYDSEKDYTDSEIAVKLAIDKGVTDLTLVAVTGSRFDHSLGSLGLLKIALDTNICAKIVDDNNIIYLINSNKTLKKIDGFKYISFLPYGGAVQNLSLYGCKYEIENYFLDIGLSRTISNEFVNDEIHINLSSGNLLVIYSKD